MVVCMREYAVYLLTEFQHTDVQFYCGITRHAADFWQRVNDDTSGSTEISKMVHEAGPDAFRFKYLLENATLKSASALLAKLDVVKAHQLKFVDVELFENASPSDLNDAVRDHSIKPPWRSPNATAKFEADLREHFDDIVQSTESIADILQAAWRHFLHHRTGQAESVAWDRVYSKVYVNDGHEKPRIENKNVFVFEAMDWVARCVESVAQSMNKERVLDMFRASTLYGTAIDIVCRRISPDIYMSIQGCNRGRVPGCYVTESAEVKRAFGDVITSDPHAVHKLGHLQKPLKLEKANKMKKTGSSGFFTMDHIREVVSRGKNK